MLVTWKIIGTINELLSLLAFSLSPTYYLHLIFYRFTDDGYLENPASGLVLDIEKGRAGGKLLVWRKKPHLDPKKGIFVEERSRKRRSQSPAKLISAFFDPSFFAGRNFFERLLVPIKRGECLSHSFHFSKIPTHKRQGQKQNSSLFYIGSQYCHASWIYTHLFSHPRSGT